MADPRPGAGVPFTVRASGATANDVVTLTITRHPASTGKPPRLLTKNASASGVVEFEVTLTEDGRYSLVSTSSSGSTLGRQSVTVVAHGSVIVAGESASASAGGAATGSSAGESAGAVAGEVAGSQLAWTGFQGWGLLVVGGAFVLTGAGLVLFARRPEKTRAAASMGNAYTG